MKKLVILLAVVFTANVMMAQKMDRTNAYNYNRNGQYEKAVESIEKCVNHEGFLGMKPKDQAQAWLYRGMIYFNVSQKPELIAKYPDALDKSFESLQNCIKADAGYAKDNAEDVYSRINAIRDNFAQEGIDNFNNKVYDQAAVSFRKAYDVSLTGSTPDTVSLMNSSLSYLRAQKYDEALASYGDLKALGYDKVDLYQNMAACYNAMGNDEMSMNMIMEGLEKYPGDAGMIIEKVNLFLKVGRGEEAIADLNKLQEMDPNNISILYTLGNLYGDEERGIFDADKAIEYYTQIIGLDSTFYDASYSLAALYLNLASKKNAEASNLGMSPAEQKQYNALMKEREEYLRAGLPYAKKAYDEQPSEEMKRALRSIYVNLNMYQEAKALDEQ